MTTPTFGATATRLSLVLGSIVGWANTASADATQASTSLFDRLCGWVGGGTAAATQSVREPDPSSAAAALTLLVGTALVVHSVRSRKA